MKRNLDSCMEGSTLCDPTRLTPAAGNRSPGGSLPPESGKMHHRLAHLRAFAAECERRCRQLHKTVLERNYDKCLEGSPTCDPTRLTPLAKQGG